MMSWRPLLAAILALASIPAAAAAQDVMPPADYDLIEQAIEGSRLVQARTMLAQRQTMERGQPDAVVDILNADLALAERRSDQALAAFQDLKSRGVADCRVEGGLGIALIRIRRGADALAPLRVATQACPERWRYWNALGVALDLSREWKASADAYERAFTLSGEASVMNNYGFSLMMQQRHTEAARLFAAAARADPSNQRYANNADIAHAMAGEPLKANDADSMDADRWARRLNNSGYAALLAGRREEARSYFSRSLHAGESYDAAAETNLAALGEGK